MTRSTSAVAVCCQRASFSSRVRAATCSWRSVVETCSWRSVVDKGAVGALRALRPVGRRTFPDRPLLRRRIVAPEAQTGDGINSRVYSERGLTECFRGVRFGSKADMCSAQAHVRFTPESDTKCDIVECPPWANSGHCDL